MKQIIKIEVDLDENHLPEKISMNTSDAHESNIKSMKKLNFLKKQ